MVPSARVLEMETLDLVQIISMTPGRFSDGEKWEGEGAGWAGWAAQRQGLGIIGGLIWLIFVEA